MAVASAGLCMQVCTLLQTENHTSTPPLYFFTGRMPFLPPNQRRQSTEGTPITMLTEMPFDHLVAYRCMLNKEYICHSSLTRFRVILCSNFLLNIPSALSLKQTTSAPGRCRESALLCEAVQVPRFLTFIV